ncbi:MAG: hypothetical protein GX564_08185 [Oligosphaeraceae bacterium]|nr:hypothetical protein [Oligosphaeraceae bacterium]
MSDLVRKCILLLCLFSAGWLPAQTGLGESLLLEGRMAMARAEQYLLAEQGAGGSWQDSLADTAQTVMALANAGYADSPKLQAAGTFLRSAGTAANAEVLILACRSMLRLGQQLTVEHREVLLRLADGELSPQARQWLLEIHYLLDRQDLPLLPPAVVANQLLLLQNPHSPAGLRLFAALCAPDHDLRSPELAAWRQEALAAPVATDPDARLWLCRALRAFAVLSGGNEDGSWRHTLTVQLLESQKHDGSWGEGSRQVLHTALSLQALQHCLAIIE